MKNAIKTAIAVVMLAGVAGAAQFSGPQTKSLPITEAERTLTPEEMKAEIHARIELINALTDRMRANLKDDATVAALRHMQRVLDNEINNLYRLGGRLPSASQVQALVAEADRMSAEREKLEKEFLRLVHAYPSVSREEQALISAKLLRMDKQMKEMDAKLAYAAIFR